MNKEFGSTLCDKLSHMVWEGGRWLRVVAQGKSFTNPALCHLYWNWVQMPDDLMTQGAVMYLCRDGLTIVLCRMHRDVTSLWSDLSVCLLSLDWRLFCGLVFLCLCTPKVLPPRQHSGQLFCPHLKPVASFFGCPLIEVLVVQLQPNCRC